MALKRCKTSFAATVGKRPQVVKVGQIVEDTDPMYVGRERYFEDVSATVSSVSKPAAPRVEQATSAPGETRRVNRPRKSTSKED